MKIFFTLSLIVFFSFSTFSMEKADFSITSDFAYYPKSDFISGKDHFSPVTGAYSHLEFRTTGKVSFLFPEIKTKLSGKLELSPVSIKPGLSIKFTPLPFLVLDAGSDLGSGWNLGNLIYAAPFNGDKENPDYEKFSPFSHIYWDSYISGTLQFDTAYFFPGDWTHIQALASYKLMYAHLSGIPQGEFFIWQNSKGKLNGWQGTFTAVLAYQMPLILQKAGLILEAEKYLNSSSCNEDLYSGYDADFTKISISPLLQFVFNKNHSLSCLFSFSSRQSFEQEHEKSTEEPFLNHIGREWYFRRIALSYTYSF